jgi:hypothetical protein
VVRGLINGFALAAGLWGGVILVFAAIAKWSHFFIPIFCGSGIVACGAMLVREADGERWMQVVGWVAVAIGVRFIIRL